MAKFKLMNLELKTVPAGKQNAGKKYLIADAVNALCIWEDPQRYVSFNLGVTTALTPLLPVAQGGTAATLQPIPEEFTTVNGAFEEFTPAQDFYKRHLSDDPKGQYKAGDRVTRNGIPVVYRSLMVFTQYYVDEFGKKQYMKGASLVDAGQRAFAAYCEPVQKEVASATPIVPAETPTPATPAATPPTGNAKTIIGYDVNQQPIYG